MTTPDDLMTDDDRLDGLALVRAYMTGDAEALQVILNHAGNGTYLAVVNLAAALVDAQSNGQPQQYLDDLADSVRSPQQD